jgi:hypothetical protein
MTLDRFVEMYLDYLNNFLTVGAFADHYHITDADAREIIAIGRRIATLDLKG